MTGITQGFFDFVAWLPAQADRVDVVKGVNDLICDAVAIADTLPKVIDKVNLVVPERLRDAARFAKTYNWLRNCFNLADRVDQWNKTNFSNKLWHEKVAMISLTAAHTLGTLQSLQDLDVLSLGSLASPFKLVQNALYIPVSASAAWNSLNKWSRAPGELRGLNQDWERVNQVLLEGQEAVRQALQDAATQAEEDFWNYVNDNYATLHLLTWSSELSFVIQEDDTFRVTATNLVDRNIRITRVKEALGFIENIGKAALGALGLVAIYFGLNTLALFSFGMIVAWTAVHLVGLSKKLFEGANKVERAADYQFPPNLRKAFGAA